MRVPTESCIAENRRLGNPVTFHVGDVNDPSLPDRIGTFDVVFCSGVLYHVPNPVLTLERLRALARQTVILGTSLIPELDVPHGALFYPYLSDADRRRLAYRSPTQKVGLDTPYREDWDYSNYFWGMTPSCVRAMLTIAHLEIEEEYLWKRAGCFVCAV